MAAKVAETKEERCNPTDEELATVEEPIKFITDAKKLSPLEEMPCGSCIIFHDCIIQDQKTTMDLFLRSQHCGIDVLILTHNYIDLP